MGAWSCPGSPRPAKEVDMTLFALILALIGPSPALAQDADPAAESPDLFDDDWDDDEPDFDDDEPDFDDDEPDFDDDEPDFDDDDLLDTGWEDDPDSDDDDPDWDPGASDTGWDPGPPDTGMHPPHPPDWPPTDTGWDPGPPDTGMHPQPPDWPGTDTGWFPGPPSTEDDDPWWRWPWEPKDEPRGPAVPDPEPSPPAAPAKPAEVPKKAPPKRRVEDARDSVAVDEETEEVRTDRFATDATEADNVPAVTDSSKTKHEPVVLDEDECVVLPGGLSLCGVDDLDQLDDDVVLTEEQILFLESLQGKKGKDAADTANELIEDMCYDDSEEPDKPPEGQPTDGAGEGKEIAPCSDVVDSDGISGCSRQAAKDFYGDRLPEVISDDTGKKVDPDKLMGAVYRGLLNQLFGSEVAKNPGPEHFDDPRMREALKKAFGTDQWPPPKGKIPSTRDTVVLKDAYFDLELEGAVPGLAKKVQLRVHKDGSVTVQAGAGRKTDKLGVLVDTDGNVAVNTPFGTVNMSQEEFGAAFESVMIGPKGGAKLSKDPATGRYVLTLTLGGHAGKKSEIGLSGDAAITFNAELTTRTITLYLDPEPMPAEPQMMPDWFKMVEEMNTGIPKLFIFQDPPMTERPPPRRPPLILTSPQELDRIVGSERAQTSLHFAPDQQARLAGNYRADLVERTADKVCSWNGLQGAGQGCSRAWRQLDPAVQGALVDLEESGQLVQGHYDQFLAPSVRDNDTAAFGAALADTRVWLDQEVLAVSVDQLERRRRSFERQVAGSEWKCDETGCYRIVYDAAGNGHRVYGGG